MKLYSENKDYKLYQGNMLDMLEVIEPESIDVKNYYGFIYITTNLINKKMYIGKKIFASNWRTYLGSGIGLKKAIQKYGKDNFNRIIIDLAKTKEELNKKEIFYIDKFNAISSSNFYNMAKGGIGGDTYSGKSKEEIEIIKKKLGFKKEKHHMFGKHIPDGATILDPFNGSGSTGKAVMYENKERNKGYKYIGIELTEEYLPIAKARIEYVNKAQIIKEEKQKEIDNQENQLTIFDII